MIYVLLAYLVSPLIYPLITFKRKKVISKILVIQTAKIGDLICSTPVFREIKRKYPDARLTVMVNPITAGLLENSPYVDEILPIENKDYEGLPGKIRLSGLIRRGGYDVAVSLNPNVPCAIALFWGLVPVRVSVISDFSGVTFKFASVFFTHLERHAGGRLVVETYLKMLNAIGIIANDISKDIYKSEEADIKAGRMLGGINKPIVGVAVSSGNKLKELEAGKIAELVNMLTGNMDVYVALVGSARDSNKADAIMNPVLRKERVVNTAGRLTLPELPALIEKLLLFIGVDTGIIYMADALSVPIVHIAGPLDITEQRPLGKNTLIIRHELPCAPCTYIFNTPYECRQGTRECVTSVTVSEVFEAARELLGRRGDA